MPQTNLQSNHPHHCSRQSQVAGWVDAVQRNDDVKAFEQLYRFFYKRLYLLIKRLVNHGVSAEDLLQESFIKAWRYRHQFRAESQFYSWLRQIASRVVIDEARKKHQLMWQKSLDDSELLLQSTADCHRDDAMDLEKLIQNLPDGARMVLVLHDIEGYSHREIAHILEIAPGTSKAQLSRARQLLKQGFSLGRSNE